MKELRPHLLKELDTDDTQLRGQTRNRYVRNYGNSARAGHCLDGDLPEQKKGDPLVCRAYL